MIATLALLYGAQVKYDASAWQEIQLNYDISMINQLMSNWDAENLSFE